MSEYNISDKNKYYRQNNNVIKPTIRCKPTATVEALDLAGHILPGGKYKQPEDNLTAYMEEAYGPNSPEDWGFIAKAINEHFLPGPQAIVGPKYDWDLRQVLFDITRGIPFVASTWLTTNGHVVNIVGFVTTESKPIKVLADLKMEDVLTIIIDDPYGDRTSGKYDTARSGFNNRYEARFFIEKLWRSTGVQVRNRRLGL